MLYRLLFDVKATAFGGPDDRPQRRREVSTVGEDVLAGFMTRNHWKAGADPYAVAGLAIEALEAAVEGLQKINGLHNMCEHCSGARTFDEFCEDGRIARDALAYAAKIVSPLVPSEGK